MAAKLKLGDIFADRYRIESILGVGGYARVYKAMHLELDRPVALKVLNPHGTATVAKDAEALERFFKRFEREAKIVSKLRAAETVEVYEYGRTDEGYAFMALEFIDGSDLLDVLNDESPLAPERVEKIISGVLRSLREAHRLGVQHRDIKPANIMIYSRPGEPDQVKLLDFGVVKITRDVGVSYSSLTSEGNVVGTPRYMAPEYIRDNVITAQSDLYAVGLIAWEMLVGEPAVEGESAVEVMTKHIAPEPLVLPEESVVSPRLRAVVNGLLEKDPRRRFASAQDVLELLQTGRLSGFTQDNFSLAATIEGAALADAMLSVEPTDTPAESLERPLEPEFEMGREPSSVSTPKEAPDLAQEIAQVDSPVDSKTSTTSKNSRVARSDPRRAVKALGDGPLELDWPDDLERPEQGAKQRSTRPSLVVIAVAVIIGLLVGLYLWSL